MQDNVALSLASVMNQANLANADAMSDHSPEPMRANDGDHPKGPQHVSLPFRIDSSVLAFFPWVTSVPMVSTSLADVYPVEHFSHVCFLHVSSLSIIDHPSVLGHFP